MIFSILDNDFYSFTVQQAVLQLFPDAEVEYKFFNRGKQRFDEKFEKTLRENIEKFADIRLTDVEYNYIKKIDQFSPAYCEYLRNYRFDPNEIDAHLDKDGNLVLGIKGKWHKTILWEPPLLATISETYFEGKSDWKRDFAALVDRTEEKARKFVEYECEVAEFGTRRRRNYDTQKFVIPILKTMMGPYFLGTSNVLMAMGFGVPPIGTMSHQFIQGVSGLYGLRHANKEMLRLWSEVYRGELGIALTDTFGTDTFLKDFDGYYARLYDGTRQDSGDPLAYTEKLTNHYYDLGIDPTTKSITYSDNLNTDKIIKIKTAVGHRIHHKFGVGTFLTNDYETPALNIVIKLWRINGMPLVKLSDDKGKEIGEPDALRIAKSTFFGEPL